VKTTPHINLGKEATLVPSTAKLLHRVLNIKPLAFRVAVRAARHTTYHTHFLLHCLAWLL